MAKSCGWKVSSRWDYATNKIDGEKYASRKAALHDVRLLISSDAVAVNVNGDYFVYDNRSDARRDRDGSRPTSIRAIVERVPCGKRR